MDLWIRSQDKRILQKVDNVYLDANYDNKRICAIDSADYKNNLGEYKSEERALEVLDEINNLFNFTYENKKYDELDLLLKARMIPTIYTMPKE